VTEVVVAKDRKRCIFCGAQNKKISNEHIIGQRFGDIFASPRPLHRRFGWKLEADGSPSEPWDTSWRPRNAPDFKVNNVCRDCNSGWMADLDQTVEPFVRPMVEDGQQQTLGPAETADLARWIAKTVIVIAHSHDLAWMYTEAQARTVMAGAFPQGFHVWALAWMGDPIVHLWTTYFAGPPPKRDMAHCITSFTFGKLYFLAMHSPDPNIPFNLQWLLGRNVDSRVATWSCPPRLAAARPDMLPEYHAGVVREWVRLLDEQGLFSWPTTARHAGAGGS
jgi:hypothetical protein